MSARRKVPPYRYGYGWPRFKAAYGVIAPTPEDPDPFADVDRYRKSYGGKLANYIIQSRPCRELVQNDETYCPACGLRWDTGEERPPCLKSDQT